jgi:tartrate-resistant acid phosphatase type 5
VQNNGNAGAITRRDALRKTILFSSGLMASGWLSRANAQEPTTSFSKKGLHFLALGDFGTGNENQGIISRQMATFSKKLDAPLAAVLALGDNFYRELKPERFKPHFEEMYPQADFDCPFYACLGNHDYGPKYDSNQGPAKAQIQLDYAKANPSSRWKMPAKWYALELPDANKPLVKMIVLDGNFFEGALTPQEKLDQKRFLEAELQKKTDAPWLWMISHFPIFTETTKRGDNTKLIDQWGGHLKSHPFAMYISGHDHNLQHLKADGFKTSFVVSGAGGASLYEVDPSNRGFSQAILGFNHIHVTDDKMTVQFIDAEGRCLHAFQRTLKGKVKILS